MLGCARDWIALTFTGWGALLTWAMYFRKSLPPEKLLEGELRPWQAEQSTRADGDEDFVHICSAQELK